MPGPVYLGGLPEGLTYGAIIRSGHGVGHRGNPSLAIEERRRIRAVRKRELMSNDIRDVGLPEDIPRELVAAKGVVAHSGNVDVELLASTIWNEATNGIPHSRDAFMLVEPDLDLSGLPHTNTMTDYSGPPVSSMYSERLRFLFNNRDPSMLPKVVPLLMEWRNREETLLSRLTSQYGNPTGNYLLQDPIPSHWREVRSRRGDVFYVNTTNGKKQWERPFTL
eukprot:TRINITY_DN22290_c0_g1_i1.p1 TRINITY_DN22290_c0_g1~~TRINITY_DN22290_c0_g1_i1.p1  ORF type:complete len:222 (+),score=24.21 TRINITY_DN22290_c0_g1_i1:84-749(+)